MVPATQATGGSRTEGSPITHVENTDPLPRLSGELQGTMGSWEGASQGLNIMWKGAEGVLSKKGCED